MFGLMTVKRHVEAIAHERYFIACRDDTIMTRNATIERLQRENARLLAEVSGPQEQKDEGATYVLKSLAECLGLADWQIQSGSETWEGDVSATMYRILVDAGVIDDEDNAVATHDKIKAFETACHTEAAKSEGLLRDKLAESERAKLAEQRLSGLLDQIKALTPDAEKHRERLRRDRENAANKRAFKAA